MLYYLQKGGVIVHNLTKVKKITKKSVVIDKNIDKIDADRVEDYINNIYDDVEYKINNVEDDAQKRIDDAKKEIEIIEEDAKEEVDNLYNDIKNESNQ